MFAKLAAAISKSLSLQRTKLLEEARVSSAWFSLSHELKHTWLRDGTPSERKEINLWMLSLRTLANNTSPPIYTSCLLALPYSGASTPYPISLRSQTKKFLPLMQTLPHLPT